MYTKEGYPVGSTSSGIDASLLGKRSVGKKATTAWQTAVENRRKRKSGNGMDFSILSPLGIFILKSLSNVNNTHVHDNSGVIGSSQTWGAAQLHETWNSSCSSGMRLLETMEQVRGLGRHSSQ